MKIIKILPLFILGIILVYNNIAAQELSPEEIFEKLDGCIVTIKGLDFNGNAASLGSGVVISEKGWIVTNYHVFENCESVIIKHKQKEIKHSDILGLNIEHDLLIFKIEENIFPSIQLASDEIIKVGQKVYAIGSPRGFENTMSEGIISGIREFKDNRKLLQFTASISPGSSGGAVINSNGELIGISTFSRVDGQNLNFAIPLETVLSMELFEEGKILAKNYYYIGNNALKSGSYHRAIDYFTKAIEEDKTNPSIYFARGFSLLSIKDFHKAIIEFDVCIALDENFEDAYIYRAEANRNLNKLEEAIRDLNFVIRKNPTNADAYYFRGLTKYTYYPGRNALSDFEKSAELGTSIDDVHHYIKILSE